MAPNTPSQRQNIIQFIVVFLVLYVVSQALMNVFFPNKPVSSNPNQPLELTLASASVTEGNLPVATVKNQTQSGVTLASRCPLPPLDVYRVQVMNGTEVITQLASTGALAIPCQVLSPLTPGGHEKIDLSPWKYTLFGKLGTYELRLPGTKIPTGSGAVFAPAPDRVRFVIHEAGAFTKLFRAILSRPFLNILIFVASITPGYNLGIAIIVLTLLVKILLFFPTQHSLEGQKKMQMLQPKLDELKKKYPNDAKKQQEETMRLWKEHGINPFSSCLPLLIQFPILLGLYYVIRDGSRLELSRHLIYPFYQHIEWAFGTNFLWLDLLQPDRIIMPITLMVLQFLQMKLTFAISKRKKAGKQQEDTAVASVMGTQQQVMLYVLPLMIGFFAFQFPAAVSLYWGVSTLFAIGQQLIVNREHLKV